MHIERLFVLKATAFALAVVLLLLVSIRMSGRFPLMNATTMYSMAPTYGTLRLPSGKEYNQHESAPAPKPKRMKAKIKIKKSLPK